MTYSFNDPGNYHVPHVVGIPDRITARPQVKRRVGERAGLRPDEITNILRLAVDKPGTNLRDLARAVNKSDNSVARVMTGTGSMAYLRSDPYWVSMVGQALDRVNIALRTRMAKAGITPNMPLPPLSPTSAPSPHSAEYHAEGDGVVIVPADQDERVQGFAEWAASRPAAEVEVLEPVEVGVGVLGQVPEPEPAVEVEVEPEVQEPLYLRVERPETEPALLDVMHASVLQMIQALGGPEVLGLERRNPNRQAERESFKRDLAAVREILADIERRVDQLD